MKNYNYNPMKNSIILLLAITLMACKEDPKNYVTLSGKITNKSSDSLVVRTRTYSKTLKVAEDGTFKDTLKVDTGIYNFYDGSESTSIFLKNGFELDVTLDTKAFDETIKYEGLGAEHSNFLAEITLMREKLLNVEELSQLDSKALDVKFDEIKLAFNEFYTSNKSIDTLIINKFSKQVEPMLSYYKKHILNSIALKTELAKGKASPVFENYENYKGGKTSLSDLKGKYVYVDVWATWCGPCKKEIPFLKEVENQYHGKNIEFVSISVDDGRGFKAETKELALEASKEGWRKMIADKDMGGIQLFSDNAWQSEFVQGYKINGIPRFILIDPDGNIVSPDAPRPSSPKLIELFTELSI